MYRLAELSGRGTRCPRRGIYRAARNLVALLLLLAAPGAGLGQDPSRPIGTQPLPEPPAGESLPESPPVRTNGPTDGPANGLALADLEQLALRNNPTLAAAAARVRAARGRLLQAGLYPNPVAGYHATEIGNQGTAGQQGGFISQRFITGGKRTLDQAIAAQEIDEAHFRFHAQQQRVLSDVRVRFHDAAVAQRRVELSRELAQIGDQLVAATKQLIEGRQGTENDLLQAEIRADQSKIDLDNAQNHHLEAWRRLVTVVGVPNMQISLLSSDLLAGDPNADLPRLDWNGCLAMVLSGNPELRAARARAQRARLVAGRAQKEPIPNVDVSLSMRHHNVTSDEVANLQVGIPIPVLDRNQGNVRSARAEWVVACNEVRRIELAFQDRLATAFRRYENARQQADRYGRRMIPRARQSLELVTQGYGLGQVQYLTLLNAQQTYLHVNLSYLDSLRELRIAASTIEGQLLTDSLAAPR